MPEACFQHDARRLRWSCSIRSTRSTPEPEQGRRRRQGHWCPVGRVMAEPCFAWTATGCSTPNRSTRFRDAGSPGGLTDRTQRAGGCLHRSDGAIVRHAGQSAHYDVKADHIQMPDEGLFTGTDTRERDRGSYYSTLLHETCHWTGHKSRLDRDLGMRFGKDAYAAEELIAELGAAFLCADLQVTPSLREDHARLYRPLAEDHEGRQEGHLHRRRQGEPGAGVFSDGGGRETTQEQLLCLYITGHQGRM